ncbi:MAG: hypothetical protein ACLVL7_05815 [Anaerotruncus massiliensis (ex Togo et al. 2019)]
MHQMKYSSITDVPIREELIAAELESNRVPLPKMTRSTSATRSPIPSARAR